MNARLFSIGLLLSALPMFAHAGITLNKGDFLSAERMDRNGQVIVQVKLSKSGKAKFKKLNQSSVNKEVHAEVGGVVTDFKLKVPIEGDQLEMGPYSAADAEKFINTVNK